MAPLIRGTSELLEMSIPDLASLSSSGVWCTNRTLDVGLVCPSRKRVPALP
jgi:hypothetical protein